MAIDIAPLDEWSTEFQRDFLPRAQNFTLFHDPDFLAYHPPTRHCFHHLAFITNGRIVAMLPGALRPHIDGPVFASPAGASTGGFVLPRGTRAQGAFDLACALVDHGRRVGWSGIEIGLPPAYYQSELGDLPGFALTRAGFATRDRQLCPSLRLRLCPAEATFHTTPQTASAQRAAEALTYCAPHARHDLHPC